MVTKGSDYQRADGGVPGMPFCQVIDSVDILSFRRRRPDDLPGAGSVDFAAWAG
tara:strand:- start:17944 stop:18105 length:162 start_codon:yes stop_codon:yes gene_type:complete